MVFEEAGVELAECPPPSMPQLFLTPSISYRNKAWPDSNVIFFELQIYLINNQIGIDQIKNWISHENYW